MLLLTFGRLELAMTSRLLHMTISGVVTGSSCEKIADFEKCEPAVSMFHSFRVSLEECT